MNNLYTAHDEQVTGSFVKRTLGEVSESVDLTARPLMRSPVFGHDVMAILVLADTKLDLRLLPNKTVSLAVPGVKPFELPPREVIGLGRKSSVTAEFVIENQHVSRQHASVMRLANQVLVSDNHSLNGTTLYLPKPDEYSIFRNPELHEKPAGYEVGWAEKKKRGDDDLIMASEHGLFGVFDGIGRHPGGRHASELLVVELRAALHSQDSGQFKHHTPEEAMGWVKNQVNRVSDKLAANDAGQTTATVARILEGDGKQHLVWGSIGDSRIYLMRDDLVTQLSVDEGEGKNLHRCVGVGDSRGHMEQTGYSRLKSGDSVVLVTDGVTGDYGSDIMSPREIKSILRGSCDASDAAWSLVNSARKIDDRTAIVVNIN